MSISKWLDHSSDNAQKHFDVVIVGGGIAGLSVAYWLQKKEPNAKIAVVEKNRVGFGASGRNAGFVTCGSTEHFLKLEKDFGLEKATEIWKFSEENHRLLLQEIIGDETAHIDYRKTGSCTVAPNEERWQTYQSIAATMRAQGIDAYEITPKQMEQDYGVQGFVGGIQYAGDGAANPIKLLGMIREKLNVEMFESCEVFALKTASVGNPKTVVHTDRGQFIADKVVLTLNAYLPLVEKTFSELITPGRGQILMTEPLPAFVQGPCYLTKHLAYFRQLPTGELLVGGFRNLARETENTYADDTTDLIQGALLKFVRDHFKLGLTAKVAYQWSGVMGFSPDGQMILGQAPGREGVYVMAGCSGHGMGLSFHAAKRLVENIFGARLPEHLDLNRFTSQARKTSST